MSRTQKFMYNSATTAIHQIFVMIAGFIIPRIMLVNYGSEVNGLVSSITQFIAYFNLVEAGLSSAAIYSLYKPLADNDYKSINSILSAAKIFYTKTGYIFLSLTIGLAVFYPIFISNSSLDPINVSVLVVVLAANGVLEFFALAKFRVLLTADQKTYIISIASLVQILINTTIIAVLGMMKVDIVLLRFIALVSILSKSIILSVYTNKRYKYLDYQEKPDYTALNKRWDALYLQILGAIHNGAPVVILTLITKNLMLVSVYTIFNMVAGAINAILSIFISGLAASFGEVIAKNELVTLKKAYNEFEYMYYSLITVVYSIAFMTIMPFIQVYTVGINDVNYNIPIIGFLFILNGLLYNIKTPQGMLVISAGLFKETKLQTTIQGLIAVISGIILAPQFGVIGVLLGSILSNIYRDIDLLFFVPKNITKLKIMKTALRIIKIFVLVMIICISSIYLFDPAVSGYLHWIINALKIGFMAVIYVVIINLITEKETTILVANRIRGMVRK